MLEATDTDLNRNCFAHSRVYTVGVGHYTYSTPGSGIANIFGELTVRYFPNLNTAVTGITNSKNEFKVYPDPTKGMITISCDVEIKSDELVSVLDMNGHVLVSVNGSGNKEINMDMTSWPAGIYFVKFGSQVRRVLKVRE